VQLQAPEALAIVVPAASPSNITVTVLPASAVPEITGVEVLTSAPGAVSTGAVGATRSSVKPRAIDEGLTHKGMILHYAP
jgi:hypothetical protein